MSTAFQGKRMPDGFDPDSLEPGQYTRWIDSPDRWTAKLPNGHAITISANNHRVTEHGNGTITVAPSILVSGACDWHGYLIAGIWTEC